MPEGKPDQKTPSISEVLLRAPSGGRGLPSRPGPLSAALDRWLKGRNGLLYLPLCLYISYICLRSFQDAGYTSFVGGLNLGIHETGHLLFFWGGETLMVAGGTLTQLLAPLLGIWQFARQRDLFAITFCLAWLGTNLTSIASYLRDARTQILPLVSYAPGATIHDWEYLLSKAGLLSSDVAIASWVRSAGLVALTLGALAALYLVWCIFIRQHLTKT